MLCKKCCTVSSVLLLVYGALLLVRDLGMWNFWNIHWATGLILFAGLMCFGKSSCKDCQKCKK